MSEDPHIAQVHRLAQAAAAAIIAAAEAERLDLGEICAIGATAAALLTSSYIAARRLSVERARDFTAVLAEGFAEQALLIVTMETLGRAPAGGRA